MLKIDHALLDTIGLSGLPADEKKAILKHMYDTLEIRVGARMAEQMSDAQLNEFEQYFEAKDDKGAFNFLQTNFPNYKELVHDEFNKLRNEVAAAAPQILLEANTRPVPEAEVTAPAAPAPPNFVEQPSYPEPQNQPPVANQPPAYRPAPADYTPPSYQSPRTQFQPPPATDFSSEQPPAGPQQ